MSKQREQPEEKKLHCKNPITIKRIGPKDTIYTELTQRRPKLPVIGEKFKLKAPKIKKLERLKD